MVNSTGVDNPGIVRLFTLTIPNPKAVMREAFGPET